MRAAGFVNAFANRPFRWLLLGLAAAGLVPGFAWNTVVAPIISQGGRYDDFKVFQAAALRLRAGADPYSDFIHSAPQSIGRWDGYVYPPLLAWLLQPFAAWDGAQRAALIIVAGYACLVVSVFALAVALRIRDRQAMVLMALLFLGFFPVLDNFAWGQVNLVLLALACIWLAGHVRGGRWWGAVALGVGIALKLLQGPLVLAHVASRSWRSLAICGVTIAVGLLAGYRWVGEYFTVVLPAVGGANGWMGNVAPTGVLMRLADPSTFMNHGAVPAPLAVRAGALAVALAAIAAGWAVTRRVRELYERRLAEAAVLVGSLPLISPLTWDGHLALQLLPLCVVGAIALPRGWWGPLAVSGAALLLMGPASAWYWTWATNGTLANSPLARPLAELPALGVLLNWVGTVWTARLLASAPAPARVATAVRPIALQSPTGGPASSVG